MKVRIDKEKCILAGECYYNHPELFSPSDSGEPLILVDELTDAQSRQHAQEAAQVCPAGAITIE